MATNPYFNSFSNTGEQKLIEDLVIESIKIYSMDMYYLPREMVEKDDILNEARQSEFNQAIPIEMYVKTVDSFSGEGDFLSKFGLQIRDSATFTVAIRRFNEEFEQPRPYEGDLVYFPLNRKIFEITHVEHEAIFYQMGSLQTYDLKTELFEYSGEFFNTGFDFIDEVFANETTEDADTLEEYEEQLPDEDNQNIQDEADKIVDWSETNPFGRW